MGVPQRSGQPIEVEVVTDVFTGSGLDAQLRARLHLDRTPGQQVTFSLSEQDRALVGPATAAEARTIWREALAEMTQRLGTELAFSGSRALTHPIVVRSHLASVESTFAEIPEAFAIPGTRLARFTIRR